MKIALCLSGYYNNAVDPESGDNGFLYIEDTIINKYNPDVFIHSWEPDREVYLKELYNPIYITCEKQKDFSEVMKDNNISQEYFDEGFDREFSPFANCKISSTLSFLYSRMCSIRLAEIYQFKRKFKYDIIITARFDLSQRDKNWTGKYKVSSMTFNPELDMNLVYSAMWDQLNAGYADQWFYSNSDNMSILASAYKKALQYFQPGSEYEEVLTTGWPDSIIFDNGFYHPHQFTNEKLKEYKSQLPLMKYPKWQCVNNHLLYKWFFINTRLYNKSGFV